MKINPTEVVELYKNSGRKPTRRHLLPTKHGCVCPLGMIFLSSNQEVSDIHAVYDWVDSIFEFNYQYGFWNGFDGRPKIINNYLDPDNYEYYNEGYDTGVAVYNELRKHYDF